MTDNGPGVESLANLATISPSCHSAEVLPIPIAKYLAGHRVYVEFNDGNSGEVDLAESLVEFVLEPLRDVE